MKTLLPFAVALPLFACAPETGELAGADAPVPASRAEVCRIGGGGTPCVPVLACLGADAQFVGQALGSTNGRVVGTRNDGAVCEGRWSRAGGGTASVTCSDGETVSVRYTTLDASTGTAEGRGTSSLGRPVVLVAGAFVDAFATSRYGSADPATFCPTAQAAAL